MQPAPLAPARCARALGWLARHTTVPTIAALTATVSLSACSSAASSVPGVSRTDLRFEIAIPESISTSPLDGRMYLMLSTNDDKEPRFQVASWSGGQPMFGLDVDGLKPGDAAVVDDNVLGHPVERLADIPAGDYYVQAMLNVYTTFNRSDGHVIKAHLDQGEGQHWNVSPGNLYSPVQRIRIDPAANDTIRIELTKKVPPFVQPQDTKYLKHVRMRSKLLSDFWGRDIEIGAIVLLPAEWESRPDARYPTVYWQGHFHPNFFTPVEFVEQPPSRDAGAFSRYDTTATWRNSWCVINWICDEEYARTYADYSWSFSRDWMEGRLPRMIIVTLQHPTPYFDDSYAVNSANNGPYADALTTELMPFIEKKFRAIGEGWSRTLYGGSTGGWESLAWQILFPTMFNGTWTNCPDPIDFRYFGLVNIYDDSNAFYPNREWEKEGIRPWMHQPDGQILMTVQQASRLEAVLGSRGRSGEQFDAWQAAWGPTDFDGYPRALWDKRTGKIDHEVAAYMRDRFDLRHRLARDWKTIGPDLAGKIHLAVGDEDSFNLEESVRLMEQFLEGTKDPHYGGSVEYGPRAPHCYSGVPGQSVRISRLTINQRILPRMAERITRTAPPGADVTSWKY
ncbi:MAG TPA: alpha/beta hydrolase-fold protein [Gemmatimonadaceae bacterium]